MVIIFEQADEIIVTYINTNVNNTFYSEFSVIGKYKDEQIDEKITITIKDLLNNKLIQPSNYKVSAYEFLSVIKKIKDNLNKQNIKIIMAKIAYDKKMMHKKEMEELMLMIELVKSDKKVKKNNSIVGYNKRGEYVYYDRKF